MNREEITQMMSDAWQRAADGKRTSVITDIGKQTFFDTFREKYNFYDPSDPDIKVISDYLTKILRERVYPAFMKQQNKNNNIDPDKLDVLLFGERRSPAFYVADSNIIGISLSSLLNQSEDGVAASLAHELLHRHLNDFDNSELQEGLAEANIARTLHEAGYAPESILRKRSSHAPDDHEGRIRSYLDEHVSEHLNYRILETSITLLRAEVGELKKETTPLPKELTDAIKRVAEKHLKSASRFADIFAQEQNAADAIDRLIQLIKQVNEVTEEDVVQISEGLKSLSLEASGQATRAKMIELVDLVIHPNHSKKFPYNFHEDLFLSSFGTNFLDMAEAETNASKLIVAYRDLRNASNYAQALEAANRVNDLNEVIDGDCEGLAEILQHYYRNINFNTFSFRNELFKLLQEGNKAKPYSGRLDSPVELPWHQHIGWAKAEKEQGGIEIALAMCALSYDDYAFTELLDDNDPNNKRKLHNFTPYITMWGVRTRQEIRIRGVRDEQGRITAIRPEKERAIESLADESAYYIDKAEHERALSSKVNWDLLENEPKNFIGAYDHLLNPSQTMRDHETPFVDAFVSAVLSFPDGEKQKEVCKLLHDKYILSHTEPKNQPFYKEPHDSRHLHGVGISIDHPYNRLLNQVNFEGVDEEKIKLLWLTRPFEDLPYDKEIKTSDFFQHDLAGTLFPKAEEFTDSGEETLSSLFEVEGRFERYFSSDILDAYRVVYIFELLLRNDVNPGLQEISKLTSKLNAKIIDFPSSNQEHFKGILKDKINAALKREVFDVIYEDQTRNKLKEVGSDALKATIDGVLEIESKQLFRGLAKERRRVYDALVDCATNINDPQERMDTLAKMCRSNVLSAKQVNKVSEIYAQSLLEVHGIDDSARGDHDDFLTNVKYATDSIAERFNPVIARKIIEKFANIAEFQYNLESEVANKLETELYGNANKLAQFGAGIEAAIDYINRDSEFSKRNELAIKFLREEASFENAIDLIKASSFGGEKEKSESIDLISKISGVHRYDVEKNLETLENKEVRSFLAEKLMELHDGFWSLPLKGRGVIMDQILFPPDQDTRKNFDAKKQEVLDYIIPQKKGWFVYRNEDDKNKVIARDFVEAFLKHSEPEDQRFILSALYVALEPGEDIISSTGKVIKETLSLLPPAGDVLAQAIANHYATSEKIRDELNHTKVQAGEHKRLHSLRNLKEALGKDYEKVKRVGPELGNGHMAQTIKIFWKDGSETASSVLKENVETRGEYRFKQFKAIVRDMAKKHRKLRPLVDMVNQAATAFKTECSMEAAEQQAQIASGIYDEKIVIANNRNVHFSTAKWMGKGDRIKHAEVVYGDHFLDLPEDTEEQLQTKRTIAKAIFAIELREILSGKHFDHDRHDGQQRIKIPGNEIYVRNLDFGGIGLSEPSEKQMTALTGALARTTLYRGKDVGSNFVQAIDNVAKHYKNDDGVKEYLAQASRALLALGNYTRYLSAQDMEGVVNSVLSQQNPENSGVMKSLKQYYQPIAQALNLWIKYSKSRSAAVTFCDTNEPPVSQGRCYS